MPEIDPQTGERIQPQAQIDPQTGERIVAPKPAISPGQHGMGTISDTLGEVGNSLKGMVQGPSRILGESGGSPEGMVQGIARSIVDPSIQEWNRPSQKGVMIGGTGHPTIDKIMRSVPILGPMTANADRINQDKGFGPAAANLITPVAAGEVAGPIAGAFGRGIKAGGGTLNDMAIGTPSEGLHGATPGAELATRGIVGSSPASLTARLRETIPQVAAENRGILSAAPQGTKINTGPLVAPSFDNLIGEGTNPRTGAASPPQIRAAANTRDQLTHVPDSANGRPTSMMRDPHLTPVEAADFKSNIYDRTNYDPEGHNNIANAGLKGTAHGLKESIEQTVPESIPSSRSLHNLVQAKEILDPAARAQLGYPTSKSGLISHAIMGAGTRAASAMDTVGSTLSGMSPNLRIALPALYAATQKKKEDQ